MSPIKQPDAYSPPGASPATINRSSTSSPGYADQTADPLFVEKIRNPSDNDLEFSTGLEKAIQFLVKHVGTFVVNRITVGGSETGNDVTIGVEGDDTDINIAITPKGTGAVIVGGDVETTDVRSGADVDLDLSTGATKTLQAVIRHVASAVNQLVIKGSATGNDVELVAEGSDGTVGIDIQPKGAGATVTIADVLFQVVTSAVNQLKLLGSATGNPCQVAAQGTDTNISLQLTAKGSGEVIVTSDAMRYNVADYWEFHTGTSANNPAFGVRHQASSVNYVQFQGGGSGANVRIRTDGSDSAIGLRVQCKGGDPLRVNDQDILIPTETVASLTTPSSGITGAIAYVSNGAAGGPCLAYCDGSNWLRADTNAAVSSS